MSSVMQSNNIVHIDTSDLTRRPQQLNIMALHLWLRNSADVVVMQPNNMVRMTQYLGIILQFILLLATSYV